MEYTIENGAHRGKAFKVYGGLEIVKPGQTRTLKLSEELSDEQLARFEADGVKITSAKKKTKKRQGLETNAAKAGVEFNDDTTDAELVAAIKAAKAAS